MKTLKRAVADWIGILVLVALVFGWLAIDTTRVDRWLMSLFGG